MRIHKLIFILSFAFSLGTGQSRDTLAASNYCRCSIGALVAIGSFLTGCGSSHFRADQVRAHIDEVPIVAAEPSNFNIFERGQLLNAPQSDLDFMIADIKDAAKMYPEGFLKKILTRGIFVGIKNPNKHDKLGQGRVSKFEPQRLNLFVPETEVLNSTPIVNWYSFVTDFKHEFGHSVLGQFGSEDFRHRWKMLNPKDFSYGNSEFSEPDTYRVTILRDNITEINFSTLGSFVTDYSKESLHEDFAETSAFVFTPGVLSKWDEIQKSAPVVAEKMKLVIEIYHQADPRITFEFIKSAGQSILTKK